MWKKLIGASLPDAARRALLLIAVAAGSGCPSEAINEVTSHDEVKSVRVQPDPVTLQVGATVQLKAIALNDEGLELTSNTGPTFWETTLFEVLTVSNTGLVTALKVGTGTIRATIKNKVAYADITVTAAPPASSGLLAYSSTASGNGDIFTIATDGTNEVELIYSSAIENQPVWSRNGTAVAFATTSGTVHTISYINLANPGVVLPVVTDPVSVVSSPTWSPDGTKLAYVREMASGKTQIFIVNRDGTNSHNISNTSNSNDIQPAWSPDGTKILFASDRDAKYGPNQYLEVYTMDIDGTHVTRLTTNDDGIDYYPAWSPDGSKIAFASDRSSNPHSYFAALDIWIMNANGSNLRNLTNNGYGDASPSWSPDGSQIAFITDRGHPGTPYAWDIWIIDATGSNPRPVTNGGRETGPAWKP